MNLASGVIVITRPLNIYLGWEECIQQTSNKPEYCIRGRGHCGFAVASWQHRRLVNAALQSRPFGFGLCPVAVPSPGYLRCARICRLAVAANSTRSGPGPAAALALKPKSPLMDSTAVKWLSPGSTPLCTSLVIPRQRALVSLCNKNEAPFRISWLLARVRRGWHCVDRSPTTSQDVRQFAASKRARGRPPPSWQARCLRPDSRANQAHGESLLH